MTAAKKLEARPLKIHRPQPERKSLMFSTMHGPVLLALAGSSGLTDEELSIRLDSRSSHARSRRAELVLLGLAEDSGAVRSMTTGRKATVWRATRAGRDKAKRLERNLHD